MGDPYRQSGEQPHPGAMMLWEDLAKRGPMGLAGYDLRHLEQSLPDIGRAVLRSFLGSLERQSKWIVERTAAMRDESERIALIGQTMRRAGLRSYTDKDGAIFVAEDDRSKGT